MLGDLKEKDINFQVGLKTAQIFKDNGYSVYLTRDDDSYISLDDRTALLNNQNIDLVVSIHANASSNRSVAGIETYCVQPSSFSMEINSMDRHHHSHTVKQHKRNLYAQAKSLADSVHSHVLKNARKYNSAVVDRKVKFNTPQVLLGVQVPSILIELGFLSHEKEATLLQSEVYQKSLSKGIYKGVVQFLS